MTATDSDPIVAPGAVAVILPEPLVLPEKVAMEELVLPPGIVTISGFRVPGEPGVNASVTGTAFGPAGAARTTLNWVLLPVASETLDMSDPLLDPLLASTKNKGPTDGVPEPEAVTVTGSDTLVIPVAEAMIVPVPLLPPAT